MGWGVNPLDVIQALSDPLTLHTSDNDVAEPVSHHRCAIKQGHPRVRTQAESRFVFLTSFVNILQSPRNPNASIRFSRLNRMCPQATPPAT